MVEFNRILLFVELFCFWYFLGNGPEPVLGQVTFLVASLGGAWSIYNGIKWHFAKPDGEGLAWSVIGTLVFVGLTARWLVEVA